MSPILVFLVGAEILLLSDNHPDLANHQVFLVRKDDHPLDESDPDNLHALTYVMWSEVLGVLSYR